MFSLIEMSFAPRRAAARLRTHPRWVRQFMVLAFASVLLAIAMHPYLVRVTLSHLPPSAEESARIAMRRVLDGEMAGQCAFLPFRLLAGWGSFALMLFYSCKAWGKTQPARFVQLFALEVHAEIALVAAQTAVLFAALFGRSAVAMFVPFGLDAMTPETGGFVMRALLNAVNPFSAWYLWMLASAVATLCEFRPGKALLIVMSVWGLQLAFTAVSTFVMQEAFHLQL